MSILLVSTCLSGLPARYNGSETPNSELMQLLKDFDWAPICPEQLGGLLTPRSPSTIVGGDGYEVIKGLARVVDDQNNDITNNYLNGARAVLDLGRMINVEAFLLQARSPSCGSIERTGSDGTRRPVGVTSAMLLNNGFKIFEVWEQGVSDELKHFLIERKRHHK